MKFLPLSLFIRNRGGSVSIIAALTLPVLVGFIALAAEFGHGLVTKTENQRVADLAAFAAGLAYSSTSSTATMSAAAKNVAALNGVASAGVTASLVTSPRVPTDQAVLVSVSTTNVLLLAPVLGFGRSLPVNAKSYAQLAATPSACMLALSASDVGITLSGGTSITAPTCTIASNNSLTVPCGDTINAKTIVYGKAAPTQSCSGGITGTQTSATTSDPLASNTGVTTEAAHARAIAALASPTAPSVATASDNNFQYSATATLPSGCTGSFSNGTWTLICATSGATYNFGTLTVGGGVTVKVTTNANATYNFSGTIASNGTALTFGAGTFNVAKGISSGGGSTTTFGAGTFKVGPVSCNSSTYSICNAGTAMTFGGPSTFVLSAGISNAGGSALVLGSGSTNSFNIGAAGDGNAINAAGGTTTTFADATGAGNLFQLVGNVTEGGGACTILSAATAHDINGNINTSGALVLGAGVYSVSGYVAFGASGGGDVTCGGSTVGVSGSGVTLAIAGLQTFTGGNCNGMVFCIAAGYNNVTLSAPTAAASIYQYLAVIGPTSSTATGGALFTDGASNTTLAGALYFPNADLALAGGASIGNQSGQCLQIVASGIKLSGGTSATASNCFSGSSSSASVDLVQ
ncbi:pilus assembly protein TadG-related protein [Beijerinckia sp. L45]|uniref:pilus assembly protein TadG-related protein n=1 Tax=Beijerinckia sp. L45 TaxID=1641855 RepID=UPI001FEF5115|nr:pilus assembly protein TadG-related protein [Beijerinckia sp. L45]